MSGYNYLPSLKGNLSQLFTLSSPVFSFKNLTSLLENKHQDVGLFESAYAYVLLHILF